jgi:acetyl esterase/lipase
MNVEKSTVAMLVASFALGCSSSSQPAALDGSTSTDATKTSVDAAPNTALCGVTTTYTSVSDVTYGTVSTEQRINLRIPDGPGPFPLLIYVHGGAWQLGSY